MAVLGIGIDLVSLPEFADQLDEVGSAFVERTFTPGEVRASRGNAGTPAHLAGRFAAKEAFIKAFSSARPWRAPVVGQLDWREVEVTTDGWGRPALLLHGELAAAVQTSLGPIAALVSITHEPALAAAVVVISEGQP